MKLTYEQVTNLQQGLKLGKSGYQLLKVSLPNSNEILPSWKDLRTEQYKFTPPVIHQTDPIIGVKYNYNEAIKKTIERTLDTVDAINLPPSGSTLKVRIKDGVDGSGSHSIYNQLNNADTHNMILYMFCILDIIDVQTNSMVFIEQQPNSPDAMRPLFIMMGKESLANLESVKDAFNQRILNIEFVLIFRNHVYNIIIEANMSMIDGKMRSLLSGLGGAFCMLCFITLNIARGTVLGGVSALF